MTNWKSLSAKLKSIPWMYVLGKLRGLAPWLLLAVMLPAFLSLILMQRQLDKARVSLGQAQAELAQAKFGVAQAGAQALAANQEVERLRFKTAQEIDDAIRKERAAVAAVVRDADATRGMLIEATRALAHTRADASDPAALGRAEARAAAFGELLATCDRVAADLGTDAEDLASRVRGLQRRYVSLGLGLKPQLQSTGGLQ